MQQYGHVFNIGLWSCGCYWRNRYVTVVASLLVLIIVDGIHIILIILINFSLSMIVLIIVNELGSEGIVVETNKVSLVQK